MQQEGDIRPYPYLTPEGERLFGEQLGEARFAAMQKLQDHAASFSLRKAMLRSQLPALIAEFFKHPVEPALEVGIKYDLEFHEATMFAEAYTAELGVLVRDADEMAQRRRGVDAGYPDSLAEMKIEVDTGLNEEEAVLAVSAAHDGLNGYPGTDPEDHIQAIKAARALGKEMARVTRDGNLTVYELRNRMENGVAKVVEVRDKAIFPELYSMVLRLQLAKTYRLQE